MDQFDKLLILRDLIQDISDQNEDTANIIQKFNEFSVKFLTINNIDEDINQQFSLLISESLAILSNYSHSLDDLDPSTWNEYIPKGLLLSNKNIPCLIPPTSGLWSSPPWNNFNIRGQDYLSNKLKVMTEAPLFHLRGVQIFRTQEFYNHIANASFSAYPKYKHHNEWLILNYLIPGTFKVQIVCYFTATQETLDVLKKDDNLVTVAWQSLLKKFWKGDKSYCDSRFKLIPNFVDGPWPIKMAIGQKPALTGKKLSQSYYRGPGYFEVDIDITSSSTATRILKMVRFQCKSIVIDLGITIQGENSDELPERVLCQCRYNKVDFSNVDILQV